MSQQPRSPSDLELQILGVLWRRGPSTVREVIASLPDEKERAYTSVLSVMQVMQKKGLLKLSPERRGLAHVYQPAVTQRQALRPMMRGMVKKIFGGSASAAVQQLLNDSRVSEDEVAEIRQLLDEIESKRKS